jgi:hypothetical protein
MNPSDHATQAEIRLANMYAMYLEAEKACNTSGPDYHDKLNAQFSRTDRYTNQLASAANELDLNLGLIFEVAKEIRAEMSA